MTGFSLPRAARLRARTALVALCATVGAFAGVAVLSAAPAAAATASSCDYASGTAAPGGGKDASGLCWFDWTGYSDATASTAAGQPFTLNIGNGYTASFTVTQRPVGANPDPGVTGEPANSSPNATTGCNATSQAGSYTYQNTPGDSRLYTNWPGAGSCGASTTDADVLITLSNISVTDPAGKPVSGYTIVTRDAETTNNVESAGAPSLTWSSDVPLTVFDASVHVSAAGVGCPANPPGAGTTTVSCSSPATGGVDLALQAVSPTTMSVQLATEAREAVAFGIETAHVTLNKTVSGRELPSDSFGLSMGDPQGSVIGSGDTGTTNSATTGRITVLPLAGTSDSYPLSETAGPGTSLSDYSQSWSCTNASSGSATTLPSGSGASQAVNPAAGDDITCGITNSASADLSIVKSASPATGVPGTNETYTLTVKNAGPNPAADATVSDPLPPNLTFVSASSGCSYASGTVTCAAGDMAAGATKTFTVVAKIASSDTARIVNTATVDSPTPDPVPGNNTSTSTVPVGPKADLAIVKTPSTTSLIAGGQVTYTLVVTDNGPSDATGVTVSDALPAGETLVSALPSQGSCSGTTCNLGTVADGGTAQILVTATVATSASGQIANTATVTGNNPDPKPGNNTGTSTITVTPTPVPPAPGVVQPTSDLQITKHVNHAKATVGRTLTYTLTVTNHGPDAAANAKITDTPSMAMKVLSAKPARGSCKVGKSIRCSLGTIANGKSVTIKVIAKITKVGTENNTGSTTSASRDPNLHNNLAKATTRLVKPKAVLHLRKIASRRIVTAGQTLSYRIKVSASKAAAHNVKVCDALPLGLSFRGASPRAKLSHGRECWTIKTLAAGRSKALTVHARALKGTSGRKVNHATATSKGLKTARAKATVRIKPAPKPPATPVTG